MTKNWQVKYVSCIALSANYKRSKINTKERNEQKKKKKVRERIKQL